MLAAEAQQDQRRPPGDLQDAEPHDSRIDFHETSERASRVADFRVRKDAHVFEEWWGSRNPPTRRFGADWSSPFISLIWRGGRIAPSLRGPLLEMNKKMKVYQKHTDEP